MRWTIQEPASWQFHKVSSLGGILHNCIVPSCRLILSAAPQQRHWHNEASWATMMVPNNVQSLFRQNACKCYKRLKVDFHMKLHKHHEIGGRKVIVPMHWRIIARSMYTDANLLIFALSQRQVDPTRLQNEVVIILCSRAGRRNSGIWIYFRMRMYTLLYLTFCSAHAPRDISDECIRNREPIYHSASLNTVFIQTVIPWVRKDIKWAHYDRHKIWSQVDRWRTT